MKTGILLLLLPLCVSARANLVINWSVENDPERALRDRHNTPLSAGSSLSGDGTLLQLGYYSLATLADPFSGTWMTLATTTMGDDGIEVDGKFSTSNVFGADPFPAPTAGTPLAIRFFDGPSEVESTFYNTVSDQSGAWNFVEPSEPSPVLDMVIVKNANMVFESGRLGAYFTNIAIPEASTASLVLIGLALIAGRRPRLRTTIRDFPWSS